MASPVIDPEWLAWVASLLGGTSRQTCASAYPPDLFYCLLDELPLHLVPRQTFSSLRAPEKNPEISFNPLCQVLRNGDAPIGLAGCNDLLDRFALQGTIAWVKQSDTEILYPFWLGPRLAGIVDRFRSDAELAELPEEDLQLLIAAEILTSAKESEQRMLRWRSQTAKAAAMFREREYAPLRSLLHSFQVAALRRYYRYLIRVGIIHLGDGQSARRYVAHNESVARFFHHQIASTVSTVVGQTVKPSYVYLASYLGSSELKKHTDREQCEFSVTLCLDFSPEPAYYTSWPIRLDTPRGSVAVYQSLGDGLVYRGTRVPHYRNRLPEGGTSTSLFFHYVPEDFSGTLD